MPTGVVGEFDESDLPPEDVLFTGALVGCKEVTKEWDDKYTGQHVVKQKYDWLFKITEGEYAGRNIRGDTFATFNVGTQAHAWITALNGGQEPAVGAEINTDHYMGTGCMFEVKHRIYKNREGEERTAIEIARLYALTTAPGF